MLVLYQVCRQYTVSMQAVYSQYTGNIQVVYRQYAELLIMVQICILMCQPKLAVETQACLKWDGVLQGH